MAQFKEGAFISDSLVEELMKIGRKIHGAQTDYVRDRIRSSIKTWNTFHPKDKIVGKDLDNIVQGTLGIGTTATVDISVMEGGE